MYDIEDMIVVGRLFLIIAVIATTSFPIMYSFSPWYRSRLGRAIMLKAVAFAVTIWLKLLLTFFYNEETKVFLQWINAFTLILIGLATFTMTYELYQIQRKQLHDGRRLRDGEPFDNSAAK